MTLIDRPAPANLITTYPDRAGEGTGTTGLRLEVSEHLRPLVAGLEDLLGLPAGWDSYGGLPTTTNAASAAVAVLARVDWQGPLPTVSPMPDGGVTLEWGGDNDGVEFEFSPTGAVTVIVDVDGSVIWECQDVSPADPSLQEALAWANKLA